MAKQGHIQIYKVIAVTVLSLPMAANGISAGFPSPADDYMDNVIDLNDELIKNPSTTFCGRVMGLSMKEEGISPKDILIIDKSLEPKNNDLAVCAIDGAFTLKRISKRRDCVYLMPANADFKPIRVTEENDFLVWGIVTYVIKNTRQL